MPLRPPAGYIRPGYNPLQVANAPTVGTASAGDQSASVAFTAPSNVGGGAISLYYAVSSPGQFTGTSVTSPVTVTGLTNGTSYTFTVWAANPFGPSPYSASSNSVTPSPPFIEDVFSTWLYTGNGSTQTITNGIDLAGKGGMVWTKERSPNSRNNFIGDSARDNFRNYLYSNLTNSQSGLSGSGFDISSVSSTGYSLGADNYTWNNESGSSQVSWTFRKQPKFFDVVTWTGNGTGSRAISHSLASTPGCIILKRTDAADDWYVVHRSASNFGNYAVLNTTAAFTTSINSGISSVGSTSFTVSSYYNSSGATWVAYIFGHDAGGFGLTGTDNVISCGEFTTDGSGNATVNLGYEPQWALIKPRNSTGDWVLIDTMRSWVVGGNNDALLYANTGDAEVTGNNFGNPTATGFTVGGLTFSNTSYIYIAIRRGPMRTPTTGTSVFNTVLSTSATASMSVGFPPDSVFQRSQRTTTTNSFFTGTRLTGNSAYLQTWTTDAEGAFLSWRFDAPTNNFTQSLYSGSGFNAVDYFMRRAPGFFDVVCYTGNGTAGTAINHNLGVVPELVITKKRSGAASWYSLYQPAMRVILLNNSNAYLDASSTKFYFGNNSADVSPTASTFTVASDADINQSGATYVAYLFASVAGVSKVGSYTGTGALQTINCGFTGGARFVLIKRTDSAGSWYVYDSARGISSGNDPYLLLNGTAAEVTGTNYVDTTSVGFQVTAAAPAELNANGGSYIFLAIS